MTKIQPIIPAPPSTGESQPKIPRPPSSERPRSAGPGSSPFWPEPLGDLFLRPTTFFSEQQGLGRKPYFIVATLALGMTTAIDRIATEVMRAQAHADPRRLEMVSMLAGSWTSLWAFVFIAGAGSAIFYWFVGGWWFRVRLGWAGARNPDKRLARLLLVYSSFVFAGPIIVSLVAQTFLYPNFLVAFEEELSLSTIALVMIIWSMFTAYKGALVLFDVSEARAQFWFLWGPAIFYVFVLGGLGALIALV